MHRFVKSLFLVTGLTIAGTFHAQHHANAWFRASVKVPVGAKFMLDNEFQHRRQNGIENHNMFERDLLYSYRNWVKYQHKEDLAFSISPFAYFKHYRMVQNHADLSAAPLHEWRFSAAVDMQHELFPHFFIVDRIALEYRTFESNPGIMRLCNKFGLRYEILPSQHIAVHDEHILNLLGTPVDHFYDHERLTVDVEYQVISGLKMNLGYMFLSRLPQNSKHRIHENNLFFNVSYVIPTHASGKHISHKSS